jgi:hypothetical protein
MHAVHTLNYFLRLCRRVEMINDMNAPNHQDPIFGFNFASDLSGQILIARINFACLQRASESAGESTTGSGYNVIKRCSVRLNYLRPDTIVLGNRTMHAEVHRIGLGWQVGQS